MNTNQLMNKIFTVLQYIQNDENKLKMLHHFVMEKIYEEPGSAKIPEKYKKTVSKLQTICWLEIFVFLIPTL